MSTISKETSELCTYKDSVCEEFSNAKDAPHKIQGEIEHRINTLNTQIDKHFTHQNLENDKMQHDLTELKGDKSAINMDLVAAEAKLKDIQLQIGIEVPVGRNSNY